MSNPVAQSSGWSDPVVCVVCVFITAGVAYVGPRDHPEIFRTEEAKGFRRFRRTRENNSCEEPWAGRVFLCSTWS